MVAVAVDRTGLEARNESHQQALFDPLEMVDVHFQKRKREIDGWM